MVGVCLLIQQILSEFRVEFKSFDFSRESGESWRNNSVCRFHKIRENLIGDQLLVDGVVKRLTEISIVERRLIDVEANI